MDQADRGLHRERLKRVIETRAFIRAADESIIKRGGSRNEHGWIFDLRSIMLDGSILSEISTLFWDEFGSSYPFQVGGLEAAAIPLVTAFTTHGYAAGNTDITGFFIRKSRKKDGLTRAIEGSITKGVPIILVDDLINSGKTFIRQVEVLEEAGHKVQAIWTIVRFRSEDQYSYFTNKGIAIRSIFTLDDFADSLKTHLLEVKEEGQPDVHPYRSIWKFASPAPSLHRVVPKSDPAIDGERVYVGSDSGVFWALNQQDGTVAWSFKTGFHPKGKGIFSSPALHDGIVYFGSYDGNVYALDAHTGALCWIFMEADWVGSSPALSPDLGLLFIGLEFGVWRRRGGIAAIDMKTGGLAWEFRDMPCYTHSSPLYIPRSQEVVIGSNDGSAYLFDARTGKLRWKYVTGIPDEQELDAGFSAFDIKESFAYDPGRDLIIFGTTGKELHFVRRSTGEQEHIFRAEFGFYSTPVIYENTILASSVDKNLYCIDLDTFQEKWRWHAGARIFATPVIIGGSVYIGSNAGRLTEIDPHSGREKSFLTLTERITNKVAYNPTSRRFFVPTYANEIYCIERK